MHTNKPIKKICNYVMNLWTQHSVEVEHLCYTLVYFYKNHVGSRESVLVNYLNISELKYLLFHLNYVRIEYYDCKIIRWKSNVNRSGIVAGQRSKGGGCF